MDLEQELKDHGVNVVCSRMDTIITVHMHGSTGKRLVETLLLVDKLVASKVTKLAKSCEDRIYCDPCFGPNDTDPLGTLALCKNGEVIPSKGGSQHQAKVLKMLKDDKLKWQRPQYASEKKDVLETTDDDDNNISTFDEPPFCEEGRLFEKSASSGDVIQGNLGDCWFLGAISVLATRMELLLQVFWREDQYKQHGMFVCRFMKDFSWHYVIIDDRIPVFGYTNNRAGKPFFARCSDPNELWVPLIEKAYAKLHGSYEALIGGYIDVALSDLTGLCSEQVIFKPGYTGYSDDPFAARPGEQVGDAFWKKLLVYKKNGTLMGCSIQPDPKLGKNVVAEGSAGQGLYYKHAYGLVDVGEIKLDNNTTERLVKVRNPWGRGEWTGPWSDQSKEREMYDGEIQRVFKTLTRQVGANVFTTLQLRRKLRLIHEPQEEVTELNKDDGTFFMSYEDWRNRYTHFFAGIDFADEWCGLRVEGKWDETSNGGNTSKTTWLTNPRYQLHILKRCHLFISVSQHDPRGTTDPALFPIGFHLCTLQEKDNKFEVKEPPKKSPPYYRLYPENVRPGLCNGTVLEPTPPLIIPGTVIPGVDEDGTPQPAYTLKQAATVDIVIEPGFYCIVPSMYMRTNKETGKTNMGRFWISVYGDTPCYQLEGGEPIIEEEEESSDLSNCPSEIKPIQITKPITVPGEAERRQFENMKDEMLAQARAKGIGYREVKREFGQAGAMRKSDFKRRMMNLGFRMDEMSDEKVLILFNGMDKDKSNTIQSDELVDYFMLDIEEDRVGNIRPEKEDEEVPEKVNQEGTLEVHVVGGKDLKNVEIKQEKKILLKLPNLSYNSKELIIHENCVIELLKEKEFILNDIHPSFFHALIPLNGSFHKKINKSKKIKKNKKNKPKKKLIQHDITPIKQFYIKLYEKIQSMNQIEKNIIHEINSTGKLFNWNFIHGEINSTTSIISEEIIINQKSLHHTPYMQSLELKRHELFQKIRNRKAQIFGDKEKQTTLPRLIGGRKSGRNILFCCDCNIKIKNGKELNNKNCMAQGCINIFCDSCIVKMAKNEIYCNNCYFHENGNIQAIGMQLRSILLLKLAATDIQIEMLDEIFKSLDENNSGDLNRQEFIHFLEKLKLNPPLTQYQIDGVFHELDVDNNGSLSFYEFKRWMLGQDSPWSPRLPDDTSISTRNIHPLSPTHQAIIHDKKNSGIMTLAQTILEDILNDVASMAPKSSWLLNSNPINKTVLDKQFQDEHLIFQRLGTIQLMDNSMDGGIAKLFARFDLNGDGSIQMDELSYLVQSIGLTASPVDLRLLVHRLQRTNGTTSIHLTDFAMFLHRNPPAHDVALLSKLMELEQLCKEHRLREIEVKVILSNFYLGMPTHQLAWMAKQLDDIIGWEIDLLMLQRIALVCTPCIFDGKETPHPICAGDVLLALFSAPSGLAGIFNSFSVHHVSNAIQSLLKIEQPDVEEDLEWEKLGQTPHDEMEQGHFVECLLRRGLKLGDDSLGIESQVRVAMALDALRYRDWSSDSLPSFSTTVSRGLFTSLSRFTTLQALEEKVRQILQSMARVGSGQQYYQMIVTRTQDPENILKVYAIDPTVRHAMSYSFTNDDIEYKGIDLFSSTYLAKPIHPLERGVINDVWYPELNSYFINLLKRFRVHYSEEKKQPSLVFLESDALVSKLRNVLFSCRLPFFWAVSSSCLEISIDQATLERSKLRLQPCVIQSILKFPTIASFLRQMHSTLKVHFEVIHKPLSIWMSWNELKSSLAGLQNAYTFVQLLPQGDSFQTPTDEGGGCTPLWNFTKKILVEEPQECIHRSDRPVVYVDTQPILGKPDSTGQNLIPFTVLPKLNSHKPQEHHEKTKGLHFVVLSVRRTVPKDCQAPSLYCTAYDPTTASDYEVVGTPAHWAIDFFDPDVNANYETEWLKLLGQLKLGKTITPKLLIRVYNRQPKSDQLVGETEVSVASMMAREGYGIHSWYPIYDPVSEARNGTISTKPSLSAISLEPAIVATPSNLAIAIVPNISLKEEEKMKKKIKELENQLKEHKNQIKENIILDTTENGKWKRKYEQLKQLNADQIAQSESKVQILKEELKNIQEKSFNPLHVEDYSATATLAAMKSILLSRCPNRPFNGLKKAMVAVAETPGKISIVACEEIIDDFGLTLNESQKRNLFRVLDPDIIGIILIEEFFIRLNGDLNRVLSKNKIENFNQQIKENKNSSVDLKKITNIQIEGIQEGIIHTSMDTSTKRNDGEPSQVEINEPHVVNDEMVNQSDAAISDTRNNTPSTIIMDPSSAGNDLADDNTELQHETRSLGSNGMTPKRNMVSMDIEDEQRNESVSESIKKKEKNKSTKEFINPMEKKSKLTKKIKELNNQKLFLNETELYKYLSDNLPDKWDMQFTIKGKPYFRNFISRSTQWNHPIPEIDQIYREFLIH